MITDFSRAMLHLQSAYRVEFDRLTVEAYRQGLDDLDGATLRAAVDETIRGSAFPPAVATIRECAAKLTVAMRREMAQTDRRALPIQTADGELRTFELGGKSMTIRVLPDDHPALKRYACLDCHDTSWRGGSLTPMGHTSVVRCRCHSDNPVLAMERERRAQRRDGRAKAAGE